MVRKPVSPVGLTIISEPHDAVVDIVFVHGLQGHPRNTWTAPLNSAPLPLNNKLLPPSENSKTKKTRDFSPLRFIRRGQKQAETKTQAGNSINDNDNHNDEATKEVFWPEDFLAEDFPNARIMTFGYNTNVQQGYHAVNQGNIFSHARNFLLDLETKRRQASSRHLVFIAHSLGGILVKEMLRRSEVDFEDEIQKIYHSTTGIFFFGTPHRGSSYASFGEGVATVARYFLGMDVNLQVIHALIAGPELELCRDSFTTQWTRRGRSLTVRTFQESKGSTGIKLGGFNQLVVSPESSMLDHPSQRARTIEADHVNMVKFSNKSDKGYEMVTDDIKEIIAKAEDTTRNSLPETKLSNEECRCLQTFRTSDYEKFKDRNPIRFEDTCQWVLQNENFNNWQESGSSSLLWISADPGCGKSVFSRSLVDKDLKTTDSCTVCYFFFKDDNDKQKSPAFAFSALLHQLFSRKQSLIKYALPEYAKEGENLSKSFIKLWNILTQATSDSKAGEVVCVLDALDECEELGRYDIIQTLSSFYQKPDVSNNSKLKFVVTSRPYVDIERRFARLTHNFPTIRLRGEQESEAISKEISIVIKQRVCDLSLEIDLDESEKSSLQEELLKMEHRTYLWLKLVLDVIRNDISITTKKLKQTILTLPTTVDQAYESILSKSKSKRQAQKALHIIVAAIRPLTLKEMSIALAIEDHHQSSEDLDLENETRFATTIRNICGLFISVIDQRVYLIHQTAKEFLVAKGEARSDCWKHSLSPFDSKILIAKTCITYLMFTDFKNGLINNTANQMREKHGYLEYAATFWANHYTNIETKLSDSVFQTILSIYNTQSPRFQLWYDIYRSMILKDIPLEPSSLIVASYFGHEFVIRQLLNNGNDIEIGDDLDQTPLLWAAREGNESVVKLLLEAKANIEAKDTEWGQTPLIWAAENGHEGVVKLLLEAKANIEAKDDSSQTPLIWAAREGNESVVKLLLEAKANIEAKDTEWGQTPLIWAAENGHEGVVKLLLEAKANIEAKDTRWCQTPLIRAARNGHEGVVKLLLEAKANIEAKDTRWCQTPLIWAAQNGREGVVKLLLEAKANIEAKDIEWGQTPLIRAAWNGREGVVKLLLEAKANIEAKDDSSQTPLIRAARNEHEGVVKLLLEAKANIEAKDIEWGQTPLIWAAQNGREGVVKLLLEAKANIEAKDDSSQTPLIWAARNGREGVVKLLIEAKANIEATDDSSQTPLIWAAWNGHEGVVKLLLEAKANIEAKDTGWGQTPLIWAAESGHEGVVKLLLKAKANIEAKCNTGRTPLQFAALERHKKVFEQLLEAGADIKAKDNEGGTPFSVAIKE